VAVVGYNKTQPTGVEKAIHFVEQATGETAPPELHPRPTHGYVMLGCGVLLFAGGLFLILTARTSETKHRPSDEQEGGT